MSPHSRFNLTNKWAGYFLYNSNTGNCSESKKKWVKFDFRESFSVGGIIEQGLANATYFCLNFRHIHSNLGLIPNFNLLLTDIKSKILLDLSRKISKKRLRIISSLPEWLYWKQNNLRSLPWIGTCSVGGCDSEWISYNQNRMTQNQTATYVTKQHWSDDIQSKQVYLNELVQESNK